MARNQMNAYRNTVNKIFNRVANGVQIGIFDLGKIMNAGVNVLQAGGDEAAAEQAVVAAVQQYRVN